MKSRIAVSLFFMLIMSGDAFASRTISLSGICLSFFSLAISNIGDVSQNVRVTFTYTGNGSIGPNTGFTGTANCSTGNLCIYPNAGQWATMPAGTSVPTGIQCINTAVAPVPINQGLLIKIEVQENAGALSAVGLAQFMYPLGPPPGLINLPQPFVVNGSRPF